MISFLVSICLTLFAVVVNAQSSAVEKEAPAKSQFEQALEAHQNLQTKESIVQWNGRKYRRVEYKGEIFHLQLVGEASESASELTVVCGNNPRSANSRSEPARIEIGAKIMRRTTAFISGLKAICSLDPKKPGPMLTSAIEIGFRLDDSSPNATLKNRRILVDPFLTGIGMSADW